MSAAGDDERRWILPPPACRRCGDAEAESRRHRMRLFCPHWSSSSPAPVERGEAGSEWSEEGCWPLPLPLPWPWSRAGLLVTAAPAAVVGAEVGAACAGGCGCACVCGARGRGLGSSDVVARNAARRELSAATAGGVTSSLLDLGAGGAGTGVGAAGFLLAPLLPMPLGSGRPSELGLGYLQRNQSNGIRVSDWIEQE